MISTCSGYGEVCRAAKRSDSNTCSSNTSGRDVVQGAQTHWSEIGVIGESDENEVPIERSTESNTSYRPVLEEKDKIDRPGKRRAA